MFLTDLADVLRSEGLTVEEVPGWRTRSAHRDGLADVRAIILHHTAGARTGDYPSLSTVRYGRSGLPGPLAQIGIGRSGKVLVIAAGSANHAGNGSGYGVPRNSGNRYTIGIEAESTGRGDWTSEQLNVYPRVAAALARAYGVPVARIAGHKEWATPRGRKIDPYGWPGDVEGFRRTVATLLGVKYKPVRVKVRTTLAAVAAALSVAVSSLVAINPGTEPTSTVTPGQVIQVPSESIIEPSDPVDPVDTTPPPTYTPPPAPPVPGQRAGSESVRAQQRQLNQLGYGLAVDGFSGPKTRAAIRDVQARCGITVDGYYGPDTTRCVNNLIAGQRAGASAVVKYGDSGAKVVTLQKKLNRIGYALAVDGHAGPRTIGAVYDVQVRCGLVRDRVAGPRTQVCIDNLSSHRVQTRVLNVGSSGSDVRALQAIVGAKIDGHYGWETFGKVLKYQRAHGLKRDGVAGPQTARSFGWIWKG